MILETRLTSLSVLSPQFGCTRAKLSMIWPIRRGHHAFHVPPLLILLWLIVGCSTHSQNTSPATIAWNELNCTVNQNTMSTSQYLPANDELSPLVALAFSPDGAQLHAVNAGDPGRLVSRQTGGTYPIVRNVELDLVGERGVHFNQDTQLLAITSGRVPGTSLKGVDLTGLQIWDVESGQLRNHFYKEIIYEDSGEPNYLADAVISPDGHRLLYARTGGYAWSDANTGQGGAGLIENHDFDVYESTLVAFDMSGQWFVFGNEIGDVAVVEFSEDEDHFLGARITFDSKTGGVPLAASFHPTTPQLAMLREKELAVGRLNVLAIFGDKVFGCVLNQLGSAQAASFGSKAAGCG